MARYILLTAVWGQPTDMQPARYGRGTTVCDTAANAVGGDVIWPALCASANGSQLAQLDAAGSAAMQGVPVTTLAQLAAGSGGGGGSVAGMGQT